MLASAAAANGAAHAVWTHPASGAQLFVGAMTAAQDASFLAEAGVKYVVSCIGSENSFRQGRPVGGGADGLREAGCCGSLQHGGPSPVRGHVGLGRGG